MPGLYIHIPFCAHACPYCDFSFEILRGDRVRRYMDAVVSEMKYRSEEAVWQNTIFDSIFLGGGTPTCLTPVRLNRLFEAIRQYFNVTDHAEVTIEANPETLTDAKLDALVSCGVNRFSMGVQAFTASSLQRLGRHHSVERAIRAVRQIRQAGIKNLNLDLMFAAPEQDLADWDASLSYALDLAPEHLSTYGLTIEGDTPFHRQWTSGALSVPDEDAQVSMYTQAIDRLSRNGFVHYEVSNFARPGLECRHNLTYWDGGNYLGIGPSAHSHLDGCRFANVRTLGAYLDRIEAHGTATDEEERLTQAQQAGESILLGLRMITGLDVRAFKSKFGLAAYEVRQPVIASLAASGLIEESNHHIRLTRNGLAVADSVCAELM